MIDFEPDYSHGQIVLATYPDGERRAYGIFKDTEAATVRCRSGFR